MTFPLHYKKFWLSEILDDTSQEVENLILNCWKVPVLFSVLKLGNCACSSIWTPYVHSCCNECTHKYQTICKYHINIHSRIPVSVSNHYMIDGKLVLTHWVQIFLSLSPATGVSTPSAFTQLILSNSMFPCVTPGRCPYCPMATIQTVKDDFPDICIFIVSFLGVILSKTISRIN